jgi:hypothetical protein
MYTEHMFEVSALLVNIWLTETSNGAPGDIHYIYLVPHMKTSTANMGIWYESARCSQITMHIFKLTVGKAVSDPHNDAGIPSMQRHHKNNTRSAHLRTSHLKI